MIELINKLKLKYPNLLGHIVFEGVETIDMDCLATSLGKIIDLGIKEGNTQLHSDVINEVMSFFNENFDAEDIEKANTYEVTICEFLVSQKYGYRIAENLMNKELLNFFLDKYPKSKYENSWDGSKANDKSKVNKIIQQLRGET